MDHSSLAGLFVIVAAPIGGHGDGGAGLDGELDRVIWCSGDRVVCIIQNLWWVIGDSRFGVASAGLDGEGVRGRRRGRRSGVFNRLRENSGFWGLDRKSSGWVPGGFSYCAPPLAPPPHRAQNRRASGTPAAGRMPPAGWKGFCCDTYPGLKPGATFIRPLRGLESRRCDSS